MATRPRAKAQISAEAPALVKLEAVFGFVDEYGDRWHWESGQIVRNPFVIEMLIRRSAPIEKIKE